MKFGKIKGGGGKTEEVGDILTPPRKFTTGKGRATRQTMSKEKARELRRAN